MSLSERLGQPPAEPPPLRPRGSAPRGWEPGVKYEGGRATEATVGLHEVPADEAAWRAAITEKTRLPVPDDVRVELAEIRYWGDHGAPMVYCRFRFTPREAAGLGDLPALMAEARRTARARRRTAAKAEGSRPSGLVAVWADPQVGKTGSRGGTAELIARVDDTLERLDRKAKDAARRCGTAVLLDAGDGIEGFDNVPQQAFTNDLSLPEQVDMLASLMWQAIDVLARRFDRVVVGGVGSNHCRWRRGKDALGKPSDDWGVHVLKQLAKAAALSPAHSHVSVTWPGDWHESLVLDVAGTYIGLAHGHQASKPEAVPTWWAGQAHGGQPVAQADILVTGHWHHLRLQPTGRSAHTGRSKWWMSAPTLDNGSDWHRNLRGEDSDPGLLSFETAAGEWSRLEVL